MLTYRQYKQAALMLWPYALRWQVLCKLGLKSALDKLQSCVAEASESPASAQVSRDEIFGEELSVDESECQILAHKRD